MKYIKSQDFDYDTQKGYAKIYRAQLRTHEQALLYLNSLSILGQEWWTEGYIKDYGMIKNLPELFFNPETEIDLVQATSDTLPSDYFEFYKSDS
jgi:hypothetical protein